MQFSDIFMLFSFYVHFCIRLSEFHNSVEFEQCSFQTFLDYLPFTYTFTYDYQNFICFQFDIRLSDEPSCFVRLCFAKDLDFQNNKAKPYCFFCSWISIIINVLFINMIINWCISSKCGKILMNMLHLYHPYPIG